MARKCNVSGKGPMSGNTRAHSLQATRRKWNVNLQTYKVIDKGKPKSVKMSTRAYRALNKTPKR
jgi:large subunit ribosomal protein L28